MEHDLQEHSSPGAPTCPLAPGPCPHSTAVSSSGLTRVPPKAWGVLDKPFCLAAEEFPLAVVTGSTAFASLTRHWEHTLATGGCYAPPPRIVMLCPLPPWEEGRHSITV